MSTEVFNAAVTMVIAAMEQGYFTIKVPHGYTTGQDL